MTQTDISHFHKITIHLIMLLDPTSKFTQIDGNENLSATDLHSNKLVASMVTTSFLKYVCNIVSRKECGRKTIT